MTSKARGLILKPKPLAQELDSGVLGLVCCQTLSIVLSEETSKPVREPSIALKWKYRQRRKVMQREEGHDLYILELDESREQTCV